MSTTVDTAAARSTDSPVDDASISCTTAIDDTRSTASSRARAVSSLDDRRAWMRSSDATVCRLFFTR